jgi:hypothetical protein
MASHDETNAGVRFVQLPSGRFVIHIVFDDGQRFESDQDFATVEECDAAIKSFCAERRIEMFDVNG